MRSRFRNTHWPETSMLFPELSRECDEYVRCHAINVGCVKVGIKTMSIFRPQELNTERIQDVLVRNEVVRLQKVMKRRRCSYVVI
jgi:hypothetical protein